VLKACGNWEVSMSYWHSGLVIVSFEGTRVLLVIIATV